MDPFCSTLVLGSWEISFQLSQINLSSSFVYDPYESFALSFGIGSLGELIDEDQWLVRNVNLFFLTISIYVFIILMPSVSMVVGIFFFIDTILAAAILALCLIGIESMALI